MPEPAAFELNRKSPPGFRRAPAILFGIAWMLRVIVVLATGGYREPLHPVEMTRVAKSLAAGQGFANPYGCITGLTAHLAPVFPYLLSFVYRLFPPGNPQELAVRIFRITIVSLAYALLPWLATRLHLSRRAGVLAGMAGAAIPLYFWIEVREDWEGPLSALLIVAGLGFFAELFDRPGVRQAVAAGLVWGVVLLSAPTFLPTFVAFVIFWLSRCYRNFAAQWRLLPALLLSVLLVLTPWTIRNYSAFHQFIFVRQNFGMELHMGFNPFAHATFEYTDRDHPSSNPQVCAKVARVGEAAINHEYQAEAMEWIRANSGIATQLTVERFSAFWRMALPGNRTRTFASEGLTLAGLVGLALCFRRHRFSAQIGGLLFLTYPISYYLTHFDPRYRYPLHPIILLFACVFLLEMKSAWGRSRPASTRVLV